MGNELVKARDKDEWPMKRFGQLSIDEHSEDGYWNGMATSENARGANLAWLDPIDVAIIRDDEIIVSKKTLLQAFAKALGVESAEGWKTGTDILRNLGFIIPERSEGEK